METVNLLRAVYLALLFISIGCVVALSRFLKNISSSSFYYVTLFCAVVVEVFGYTQLAFATNVQAAIYSNQILYLGSSFIPFCGMICVRELCKEKKQRFMEIILLILGSIVLLLVSTIGQYPIYYKSIDLIFDNGSFKLVKEYGPLHFMNPLYLLTSIIMTFSIIIRSHKKKRQVSYITSTILTVSMSLTFVVYIVERILKFEIELVPFAYVFMQISILFLLRRIGLYDLLRISAISISESKKFGFVIFNSKGKLYGSDEVAKSWFPELNNLAIDRIIIDSGTDFLDLIQTLLKKTEFDKPVYFERNDKIIEAKLSIANSRTRFPIYCLSLRDDTQQQRISRFIQNYNRQLAEQVNVQTAQLENLQNDIILSMASIVENRDANTGGHIKRTSDVVKIFVTHLLSTGLFPVLTPEFSDRIIKAAPLHDFGKIGVPDSILNKAGKFEPDEYEKMKSHAEKGAVIVSEILRNSTDSKFREIAVNVAHFHHEKWDGNGYPKKISGENIPFEARIMALADVFDALVSKRVYKERFSYDKAFGIIEESCGTHFDPILCKEFLKCRSNLEKLFNSYAD